MSRARREISIGKKYYRLTVLKEISHNIKYKYQRRFKCKCNCGEIVTINISSIGKTKSCGCILKESNRIHGMSTTRFYRIYKGMEARATKSGYKNYSDRGIKNIWENFEEFKKDMYEKYLEHSEIYGEKNTTIDREDNDGHYSKSNCRWATYKIQGNNTSTNLYLEYKGKTQSLKLWCDELNLKYQRTRDRIQKYKWSIEKAFET